MEQFEKTYSLKLDKSVERQDKLRVLGYKEIVDYSTKFHKEWLDKNATAKYQFQTDADVPLQ